MLENDKELYHWGILGMKWGIRRYQNRDGTLTPEGKIRYSNITEALSNGDNAIPLLESTRASLSDLQSKTYVDGDGKLTADGLKATWASNKSKLTSEDYLDKENGVLSERGKWKMAELYKANCDSLKKDMDSYMEDINEADAALRELPKQINEAVIQDYSNLKNIVDSGSRMLSGASNDIRAKAKNESSKVAMMDLSEYTTAQMKEMMDRRRTEIQFDEMFNTKRAEVAHARDKQAELTDNLAKGLGLASTALSVAILYKQLKK